MHPVALLGPQRHDPTIAPAMAAAGIGPGPVAVVTAGWEEREAETAELAAHLDRPVVGLDLHRRSEEVFAHDAELLEGYRLRRARVREQARLYRLRLARLMDALHAVERGAEDAALAAAERASALEMVRSLDRRQAQRVAELYAEFEERWRPTERPGVAAHRERILARLGDCESVALAGGHVAVLYNRLRLFGLAEALAARPVVAWSAGAMVLSQQIVLFHDDPPQGHGSPEVYGPGIGLCPGFVFLPHARERLRLGDARRVATMAQRFAPLRCVTLDALCGLRWDGRAWHPVEQGVRHLTTQGDVRPLELD